MHLAGCAQAGLFGDLFDFESWAPKSSQAWRLGNGTGGRRQQGEGGAGGLTEGDVEVLNRRLADARQQGGPAAVGAAAAAADAEAAVSDASDAEQQPSFLRSTDEEVSAALAQRIAEVASTKAPGGSSAASSLDESEEEAEDDSVEGAGLTGPLLRELLLNKWGKAYDLSFVRRDLPLGKTLICLNVMWTHLEQRSFPMTEEDYDEKLELVALYLNSWGQAERVESFLRQPARPRKGMPSKPIVGTAISIQLDLDDAVSLSKATGFKPAKAASARATVARVVSCSAQKQEASKQVATGVAAAALALTFGFGAVDAAYADVAGLTPCSESKAFAKRKKNEVKALNKRMKKYEEGSAPALALQATIDRTNARFDKYAKQGLLCGTDGLPHLIADPGLALRYGHAGDVFIPTIGFIYFAGWLGYAGSKYLQAVSSMTKPIEKEIIIDVPLAWKLLWEGFGWPLRAFAEYKNGSLMEDDAKITVSPR
ncbi:photosystem I reaction center subunit III [Chlorella sorokiniana]|uniref:Photosystem I reaction center subunit III n=1 Tax=Chlorella sorokiniana TaxID=3076 RepID=A0A2P6TPV8_CHLSO|nr:photosystem I reaction center subunit III [Chlorella sorokiniana]|eukprot:PRW56061.1 photosystem I reaction center subunit III [Chlorella sorokiniana]